MKIKHIANYDHSRAYTSAYIITYINCVSGADVAVPHTAIEEFKPTVFKAFQNAIIQHFLDKTLDSVMSYDDLETVFSM